MEKIALCQLKYPYGKNQTYLGGSLLAVASQIHHLGYDVSIINENLEKVTLNETLLGITITGAPYIPSAIKRAQELHVTTGQKIFMGGQCISKLTKEEFVELFGKTAIQIKNNVDLLNVIVSDKPVLPNIYHTSLKPALEKISPSILKKYLENETTLFLSQGCGFNCKFCAAEKNQPEKYRNLECLKEELEFLLKKAKEFGAKEVQFYASNLDFFQKTAELRESLILLADLQKKFDVKIKVRCLACMSSFLNFTKREKNFAKLLKEAGVWCIGFGVDGLNDIVWKSQKKNQNQDLSQVWQCLQLCNNAGILAETLLIMGFTSDTLKMLWQYLYFAFKVTIQYKDVMLRPYVAKEAYPGNEGWAESTVRAECLKDPNLFYNLDFCAMASSLTHPRKLHRWTTNIVYLLICGIFWPFGKCCTAPLVPQGKSKTWNKFANWWNKVMPFDR